MKRITIEVTEEFHARLVEQAKKDGRSLKKELAWLLGFGLAGVQASKTWEAMKEYARKEEEK